MSLAHWFEDPSFYRQPSSRYHLGLWHNPEDFLPTYVPRSFVNYPLEILRNFKSVLEDADASVSFDEDKFQANVDVQQFKPEEISVKVTGDNTVTIEGKHEEKQDEHGYISRHFVRRYVLPENCDIKQVQSKLSSDGVLSITAPKVGEGKAKGHREIPIVQTCQPVKKIEQKKASENAMEQ